MRRRACLFFLLAGAVQARANSDVPMPDGFRLDDYNAPVPAAVPGGKTVHTAELAALVRDSPGVVLVDVLPASRRPPAMQPGTPWMPEPHRDLPGSVWLPDAGRGALPPETEAWFERALQRATGGDQGRALVFYCRANCWMSWNAAKRAVQHGWRNVYWYPDGPEAWEAAGNQLAVAEAAD